MAALVYHRRQGMWVARGRDPIFDDPGPGPDPEDPPPAPASWQAAIDSQDITQVALWYEAHTGHDGINPDDPEDLPLSAAQLTGSGAGITSQYDGEIIYGKVASSITISHNNVKVWRCRVIAPSLYGLRVRQNSSNTGALVTGVEVGFTTFVGDGVNGSNAPIMVRPGLTPTTSVHLHHCEIDNFSTGGRFENRCIAEYVYQHDAFHPPGGHASGIRFMGAHGIARRNLLTDARSSNLGMYLDQGFMHSTTYEENIVGGTITMPGGRVISPLANPSYGMTLGMGDAQLEPYDLKILNNWFYGGYQYGLTSGNIPWGVDGNVRSGNRALIDFSVQPGTSNEAHYQAGQLLPFNDI